MTLKIPYDSSILPHNVRSRFVDNSNGLEMHILEAGYETFGRPALLLLHGFPEIAFSWRNVMPLLADSGYHVIAPDLRGYGRTIGWGPVSFDDDLGPFTIFNAVRDAIGLINALGYDRIAGVVGHDYGASIAAWCALIRPDIFSRCVLMSAPFDGAPKLPEPGAAYESGLLKTSHIDEQLRILKRPRKHYYTYYSTRQANEDMSGCDQGIHDFLRAYFHHKSADWKENKPFRLNAWTATELEKMPTYYIMELHETMPETVAKVMPNDVDIQNNHWLTEDELAVYTQEYIRNGFQGGLNWYRRSTTHFDQKQLQLFSGKTIDIPSCFISGASDWGVFQRPGVAERMNGNVFTDMRLFELIADAGHWVQQEQPEKTCKSLLNFLQMS